MHARTLTDREPRSKPRDSQRESTFDNDCQPPERDFGGVSELPEPVLVDEKLLRMCRNELEAVNLCIDMSRMADEALCSRLGIDKGHWSRMRKGRAHFPTAKRISLMRLAGNWAPLQYELYRTPLIAALREQWKREQTEQGGRRDWYGNAAA